MNTKRFYRVSNLQTHQGLWYDINGKFTGLIHNKFNFCLNNQLPMPFDPEVVGYLSATTTLKDLFLWFTEEDILNLQNYGYSISVYESSDYKFLHNHWLISQANSKLIKTILL